MIVGKEHISREDLYEKVWQRPLTRLAPEFKLSDRGLAKLCHRMEIPLPGRGHWRKVSLGQRVHQKPLKPPSDQCTCFTHYYPGHVEPPKSNEPNIVTEAKLRESQPEHQIVVPKRVGRYHSLVSKTLKQLLETGANVYGRCSPQEGSLSIFCSMNTVRRAARIFNTLIEAFNERKHSVEVVPGFSYWHPNPTILSAYGERLLLSISEKVVQKPKEEIPTSTFGYTPKDEMYQLTGCLVLELNYCNAPH